MSNLANQTIELTNEEIVALASLGLLSETPTGYHLAKDALGFIVNTPDSSGSGGGTWGSITGTLSDQTDLITALNAKADLTHTHDAADINVLGTVPGIYDPGDLETTLQSIGNSVAAITGGGITNEQSIVNAIIFG